MLKSKKFWLIMVLLLAAGGAGWWFMSRVNNKQGAESPAYRYQLVERANIISTLEGVGTVQPVNSYTVKALVTGEVLSAPFKEGDMIEAGQLLYQIDAGKAQNSYTISQLNLRDAQADFDKLKVGAPAAGQVVKIHCALGDSVNVGSQLIYLRDRNTMQLELPFQIADAEQLQAGQPAEVILESTGQRIAGTIKEIASVEQVSNGVLTHKVTILVANPGSLQEGDWATAEAGGFTAVRSGIFDYSYSEQVLAKCRGDVAEILVQEGAEVHQGQILLRLTDSSVENTLQRAKIELQNAQAALDDYTIISPIAGTVIEKKFERGDTIDSNNNASEMAVIYDMRQLEFVMNVDELDIGLMQVGQPVRVVADALQGQEFTGYVSKISIKGNSNNGVTTYPITVTLEDFGALLPGMNINAEVVLQQAENVLVVPMNAISRGSMLLVADSEGAAGQPSDLPGYSWREVELGMNDDYYVEVISGLQEGEKIAIPTGVKNADSEQ